MCGLLRVRECWKQHTLVPSAISKWDSDVSDMAKPSESSLLVSTSAQIFPRGKKFTYFLSQSAEAQCREPEMQK